MSNKIGKNYFHNPHFLFTSIRRNDCMMVVQTLDVKKTKLNAYIYIL